METSMERRPLVLEFVKEYIGLKQNVELFLSSDRVTKRLELMKQWVVNNLEFVEETFTWLLTNTDENDVFTVPNYVQVQYKTAGIEAIKYLIDNIIPTLSAFDKVKFEAHKELPNVYLLHVNRE